MNKDFTQYALKRCEEALKGNVSYMILQSDCTAAVESEDIASYSDIVIDLQNIVGETCYIKGFSDAIRLMSGSNEN